MGFEQWLQAHGWDASTLTEQQTEHLRASYDAEQAAALADVTASGGGNQIRDLPDQDQVMTDLRAAIQTETQQATAGIRTALQAERDRVAAFAQLEATYADDIEAETLQNIRAQADEHSWDADRYELQLRRDARPQGPAVGIRASGGELPPGEVIECSMLLASGWSDEQHVGREYSEEVVNRAMERHNRSWGLRRLAHSVINAAGLYAPVGVYDNEFISTMLRADRRLSQIQAAPSQGGGGNISPVSVGGILSNVMHKLLLRTFMGDSNGLTTLNVLSSTRPVSDFKDHPVYRLTGDGEYAELQPGGELKSMSLQEEENKIHAETRGVFISLNREQIVNDDLNAFAKIPAIIGRKARMKYLKVGYATFLDDAAFYTTARGNLLENNPFDINGLTAAVQKFMKIRDLDGDPVDVLPRFVVVPSGLAVAADQIYTDTNVMVWNRDTTATVTDQATTGNPHKGKYQPYPTSWIDADAGGADDSWYLCSDDPDMKPLQRCFLNGVSVPTIERIELPADMLGMGWRSYWDFGFARQEWRGSIKCLAGAAVLILAMRGFNPDGTPMTDAQKAAFAKQQAGGSPVKKTTK